MCAYSNSAIQSNLEQEDRKLINSGEGATTPMVGTPRYNTMQLAK